MQLLTQARCVSMSGEWITSGARSERSCGAPRCYNLIGAHRTPPT